MIKGGIVIVNIRYIPLPQNKVTYKKTSYAMDAETIVIHNTANIATADGEVNYMHSSDDYRSFHFAVDDVEAVQGLPLDVNSWHAGDGENGRGNRRGIAIEICYSYNIPKNGISEDEAEKKWYLQYKAKFERAQENAAELTAYLLNKMGWGCDLSRVTKHQDYDNKYCPHRTLSDYGWDYFLNLVKAKYKELYEGDEPMTSDEKKEVEKIQAVVKAQAEQIEKLRSRLDKYDDMGVYDNAAVKWAYIDKNLPEWAAPTIKTLVNKGYLKGNDNNSLELSYLMMRILVIMDRAGAFI